MGDLPEGINVQVMRWANHLNVRVTMSPRPDGQDGACGNNNNDPNDDTEAVLKARIGAIIPSGQLLFHHQAQVAPAARSRPSRIVRSKNARMRRVLARRGCPPPELRISIRASSTSVSPGPNTQQRTRSHFDDEAP